MTVLPVTRFCPSTATTPCIKALTSPVVAAQECTGNYQHVEQHVLNASGVSLDAVVIDVAGNGKSDMLVKGIVYSAWLSDGAPRASGRSILS